MTDSQIYTKTIKTILEYFKNAEVDQRLILAMSIRLKIVNIATVAVLCFLLGPPVVYPLLFPVITRKTVKAGKHVGSLGSRISF